MVNMKNRILLLTFISFVVCSLSAKSEQQLIANFQEGWSFWSDSNTLRRTVSLPHDAMQTENRNPNMEGGHHSGYFPGNVYHYEKTINVSKKMLDKHVAIRFESVYRNATVSVNGKQIGSNKYGWTSFTVNLDGNLKEGANTIRVDADNSQVPNSRWYTGAGIIRPAHLIIQNKTHIEDVRITTVSLDVNGNSAGAALVAVRQ